jgi:hypothetical protein
MTGEQLNWLVDLAKMCEHHADELDAVLASHEPPK